MKKLVGGAGALLALIIFACASGSGVSPEGAAPGAASGAAIRRRGQGIRLAVLPVEGVNFTGADQYLSAFAQGRLNSLLTRFTGMTVIDRQNLDTVLAEQRQAAGGAYSDENFVGIGHLVNARYILTGSIIKMSGTEFSVELGVTDTETGERRGSFVKNCGAADLRGGRVFNEAAADLLAALGVNLNPEERQEIINFSGAAEGDDALARAITAQRNGSTIEALNYYYQAASFDATLPEAQSRLDALSLTATGGDIGAAVQSDYAARAAWLNLFKECAAFFRDHPPFGIVYEPDIQWREEEIDFHSETVPLSFRIALVPSESGFQVLNGLLSRLEQTGNRAKWGFGGWPLNDVEPRDGEAVVFGGRRSFSFTVEAAIINDAGKNLGTAAMTLTGNAVSFTSGNGRVNPPDIAPPAVFRFPGVNANDLTENMMIRITRIDGMSAETAGERGYIRVEGSQAAMARAAATAERQQAEAWIKPHLVFENGTITKYNGPPGRAIVIPADIDGHAVTVIGKEAFFRCRLTGVIIPDSVTAIGDVAFSGNKLTSVVIPDSVITIGRDAFSGNKLISVVIPDSVTEIGRRAFFGNKLTSVVIPDGIISIGADAFTADDSRFYGDLNSHLTSITIGANADLVSRDTLYIYYAIDEDFVKYYNRHGKRAGTYIYRNRRWARQENVRPQEPVDVARYCRIKDSYSLYYSEIPTITAYNGPDGVDIVIPSVINGQPVSAIGYGYRGNGIFSNKRLTGVVLPDTLLAVMGFAFFCNNLTSVIIPGSVTTIAGIVFSDNLLTSVTIPDSVTSIGEGAFAYNLLTSVIISGSVTSIEERAFADNLLVSVTISGSVTTIGQHAFADNLLVSVTISGSVTTIEGGAFANNLLTSITIGGNVNLGVKRFSHSSDAPSFDNNFDAFYNNSGKRAGTYVYQNGQWSRQ